MAGPSYRQLALGISLASHLAAGSALIMNAGTSAGERDGEPSSLMQVRLVRLQSTPDVAQASVREQESHPDAPAVHETITAAASPRETDEPVFLLPKSVEPHYYPTRELGSRPRVVKDVPPNIRFDGVPAQTVILRLFINEEGGVDRVDTELSYLPEDMARNLSDTFSAVKFQPGMRDGVPVKSQMRIEVRLDNTEPMQQ